MNYKSEVGISDVSMVLRIFASAINFNKPKMRFAKIMVATAILSSCTNGINTDAQYDDKCEVVLSFSTEAVTRASTKPEDYFSKINLQMFNEAGEKVFTTVKTQTKYEQSFAS